MGLNEPPHVRVLVQQGGGYQKLTVRLAFFDPLVRGDQFLGDLHLQDGISVRTFVAIEQHIGDPHNFAGVPALHVVPGSTGTLMSATVGVLSLTIR